MARVYALAGVGLRQEDISELAIIFQRCVSLGYNWTKESLLLVVIPCADHGHSDMRRTGAREGLKELHVIRRAYIRKRAKVHEVVY